MSASGQFEAFCNNLAYTTGAGEAAQLRQIETLARGVLPACRLEWSGSVRKSTATKGSDLDVHVHTNDPVTEAQRRALRSALADGLGRSARVGFHAVRISRDGDRPGMDLAFGSAAFGSRPLPDFQPWHGRPHRQQAVRALKAWLRSGGKPVVSGWMLEELVLFRDVGVSTPSSLELFMRVVDWLATSANPGAIEAVLRPKAQPKWQPAWSQILPGRLEAIANSARQLQNSRTGPSTWRTSEDISGWLTAHKESRQ